MSKVLDKRGGGRYSLLILFKSSKNKVCRFKYELRILLCKYMYVYKTAVVLKV